MMDFFYDLCYILPLNIAVSICCLTYAGKQEYSLAGCLLSSVIVVCICGSLHMRKKSRVLFVGALTTSLLGLFWVLGEEKRVLIYENYGFMLYLAGVAVICILAGKLTQRYIWAKIAAAVLLLGNATYLMFCGISISQAAVAFSFLVIMIYLATIIQSSWKKSGYTDLKRHISLITPVMLIVVVIICAIPAPGKPYDWQFAKNIWRGIVVEYNRFSGFISGLKEEYTYSGFADESAFGSDIKKNDREVFVLTSENRISDVLYMGGIAFEDFASGSWKTDYEESAGETLFDLIETKAAIEKYDPGYAGNYLRDNTVRVESRLNNTKYIFHPLKTNIDYTRTVLPEYKETGGAILTASKIKYGETYSLFYYRLNYSYEELINLIDNAQPLSEKEWNDMLKLAAVSDKETYSYQNYLLYREAVYARYSDTLGISGKLADVVEQVTEGIEGNYERLQALADYLRTMEYDTSPGNIPSDVNTTTEYLDYFIMESRKGYCVHYATAFVLLARACGYPARYVQGYAVSMDGTYEGQTVKEAVAHSWAEVYFDDFGWVVFEATPGYSVPSGWKVKKRVESSGKTEEVTVMPSGSSWQPEIVEDVPAKEDKNELPVRYFIIPLVLAVVFGLIWLVINRQINRYRYSRMSISEKTEFVILRNLRLLKFVGYPIFSEETIEEYRKRVSEEEKLDDAALEFLKLYEKMRYSNYEADEKDLSFAMQSHERLRKLYRGQGIRALFMLLYDLNN